MPNDSEELKCCPLASHPMCKWNTAPKLPSENEITTKVRDYLYSIPIPPFMNVSKWMLLVNKLDRGIAKAILELLNEKK